MYFIPCSHVQAYICKVVLVGFKPVWEVIAGFNLAECYIQVARWKLELLLHVIDEREKPLGTKVPGTP